MYDYELMHYVVECKRVDGSFYDVLQTPNEDMAVEFANSRVQRGYTVRIVKKEVCINW